MAICTTATIELEIVKMTLSTRVLPPDYTKAAEINLATSKGLAILLNIVGTVIALLSMWLLLGLIFRVHPELRPAASSINFGMREVGRITAILLGLTVFNTVVHELIHGFFFWRYTGSRPVFALKLSYAYAAAPEWFIPKRQYFVVALAPLVVIDAAALLVIWLGPAGWAVPAAIVAAVNTGGAVGDLWVVIRLLFCSPACMVQDKGDGISFHEPV